MKNWKHINGAEIGNSLIDKIQTIGKDSITMKSPNGDEVIIYKNGDAALKKAGEKQLTPEHYPSIDAAIQKYKSQGYKTGNASVEEQNEKLFHSLKKDVEGKEEDNDEKIEKVGNRLDWSENLVGKYVWVKSKGDEWKFYVLQDKGDKIYGQDTDGHMGWVSKERITGKVNNSKIGNADSEEEASKQEFIKVAKQKGWSEAQIKDFIKQIERESSKRMGNISSDDKFAYVMREFDEGKLKTPDGKVVTSPEQAKAIAYSESKKAENGLARARNAMNPIKYKGYTIKFRPNSQKYYISSGPGDTYVREYAYNEYASEQDAKDAIDHIK